MPVTNPKFLDPVKETTPATSLTKLLKVVPNSVIPVVKEIITTSSPAWNASRGAVKRVVFGVGLFSNLYCSCVCFYCCVSCPGSLSHQPFWNNVPNARVKVGELSPH